MKAPYVTFSVMAGALLMANQSHGEALRLESAGALAGLSQTKSGNNYYQEEIFAHWNLPWRWGSDDGLHCQPKLGISAGWLRGWNTDAFLSTVGPHLSLGCKQVPIFIEGGVGPTIMSRDRFGPADFGSHLQFTTYGGLAWACGSHLRLGYRYQHMSNGGLAELNPGLNLHAISVGWRF